MIWNVDIEDKSCVTSLKTTGSESTAASEPEHTLISALLLEFIILNMLLNLSAHSGVTDVNWCGNIKLKLMSVCKSEVKRRR